MAKRLQEVYCEVLVNIHIIHLWADTAVIEQVREMEAVNYVQSSIPGCHRIGVDPRYDTEEVAKEIEALA